MGGNLLWTGLTFIVALGAALELFGLHASTIVVPVGAVLMVIGLVLSWIGK